MGLFCFSIDSSGEPAGHPDLVTLVLRVVPGPSLKLGPRHARTVLAPQYMLPWIASQVYIVLRVVLEEIWVSLISVRFQVQ